jgi:hypothetical protein
VGRQDALALVRHNETPLAHSDTHFLSGSYLTGCEF